MVFRLAALCGPAVTLRKSKNQLIVGKEATTVPALVSPRAKRGNATSHHLNGDACGDRHGRDRAAYRAAGRGSHRSETHQNGR